jgi:hypothetical protein
MPRQIREKRHADGLDVNAAAMGTGSATAPRPQPNPSRAGNSGATRAQTSHNPITKFTPTGQGTSRCRISIFLGHLS